MHHDERAVNCDKNEPIFVIPPDLVIGEGTDILPLAGEVNWGMEVFGIDAMRTIADGTGIVTGLVDTGVDRTHPLLTNCVNDADFTNSPSGPVDKHGHGTHVTGTVGAVDPRIGVAPGCKTIHAKGLSDTGAGGGNGIASAIRWCINNDASIISMSLGSSAQDQLITQAIKDAASLGIWVIAAAGNSGLNTPDVDWPGRSEHCISVAALNKDLSSASFSNTGAKIDTSGPGVNIWSLAPGGGFRQMSGTSMATPFVAGLLTLFRSGLKARGQKIPTVYELRDLLFSRSTDIGPIGKDNRTGPGWITPLLLALQLNPDPPPVA